MNSVASQAQERTRGKRRAYRDVEELDALEVAQDAARGRLIKRIRAEWDEFVARDGHRDETGHLIWDERLMRSLADDGLATLRYLARGGDRVAALWLAENFLGQPDLPYQEKIKRMDEATALGQIEAILANGGGERGGLSEISLAGVLSLFANPPPPLEEGKPGTR